MFTKAWRKWLKRSSRPAPKPVPPSRRTILGFDILESRVLPASTITILSGVAGSGSLDAFLSPTDGTITTADGGSSPGTLSTGALAAVNSSTNISILALSDITFSDLGGTLSLQTGLGQSA